MIPAAFDYQRASTVDEAVELLGEHGDDAKLLAGGHSLLPLMRLRLAAPGVLIDIGRLADLSYVRSDGGQVRIGALTRHHDLATSDELREQVPMLAHIAGQIGDPQVRHRGTIGGAIAHGDPASDLPAAVLALRGTLVARGPGGEREIPADEMFTGFLETALAPDEVLTEIRVPAMGGAPVGLPEVRPARPGLGDRGMCRGPRQRHVGGPGVGLVHMGATPLRAPGVEEALRSGASPSEAAARADEGTEPPDDLNASAEYRRHLAQVLVRRALESAQA